MSSIDQVISIILLSLILCRLWRWLFLALVFTAQETEALRGCFWLMDTQVAGGWEKWYWTLAALRAEPHLWPLCHRVLRSLLDPPEGMMGFSEEDCAAQKTPGGLCSRCLMTPTSVSQWHKPTAGSRRCRSRDRIVFKLSWPVARC